MSTVKLARSVWISSVFALWGCGDEVSAPGAQVMAGNAATAGGALPAAGAAAVSGGGPSAGLGSITGGAAAVSGGGAGMVATGAAGGSAGMSAPGAAGSAAGATAGSAAASGGAGAAAQGGGPTFTRIWNEVLMLKGCSGQYCHGSGMGGLGLKNKREAYDNLVNKPAAGPACAAKGGMRVKPMEPDASLLLDKLSHATPSCGDIMPIGAKLAPNCVSQMPQVCTTEQELSLVRDWILAGAKDD